MGMEIARRGLSAHQSAIEITGHNISNADNKHYARQRVRMDAMNPLYDPSLNRAQTAGMLGQGVQVTEIERIRDHFVDNRIMSTEQSKNYWQTREKYLKQTEMILNEPSDVSLRSHLDRFWQSWQELSQFPEEMAHREQVRTRALELTGRMRETFNRFLELRQQADNELQVNVNRLNDMASEVRDLNERILKSEALGDNPNDLKDRRDQILQEMSKLGDISVERLDKDELIVYLGGEMLVQGEVKHRLKLVSDPSNEGLHKVVWEHNNQEALFRNGSIQSLLEVRDGVLKENIEKIDLLALNIADTVNQVHRDGFGLTGETNVDFFEIDSLARNVRGNFDMNGDGTYDTSAVFRVTGRNELEAKKPIGISGTMTFHQPDENNTPVYINYRADETLEEVIRRINKSGAGVSAHLDHNNRLVLKADTADDNYRKSHMIRHLEDSGELLTGFSGILFNSGPQGAFDYRQIDEINKFQASLEHISLTPAIHPAGGLRLSVAIEGNPSLIAAAMGKDVGGTGDANMPNGAKDGSNAIRIAQALKHRPVMVGDINTPDEFYNAMVSKVGVESRRAQDQVTNQNMLMTNLENMRQQVMGVNLDEEMANMVQFQHGYNAAARVMQTMNEMLDRVINRLF